MSPEVKVIIIDPDKLLDDFSLLAEYDGSVMLRHDPCELVVDVKDAREVIASINNHVCRLDPS